MRHYVLTRAVYGPEWSTIANRRRLALTQAVTARLMAAQTNRDWTWVVLLDERDALFKERIAVFEAAAPKLIVLPWQPERKMSHEQIAAAAYRAPWVSVLGERDEMILQTRLDDDDGLTPDALERIQKFAQYLDQRTVLVQPVGFRVWAGRGVRVVHTTNAMQTLVTPPGDTLTVYDYGHRDAGSVAPNELVDWSPAWLWVRHVDTISGRRSAEWPVTSALMDLFPIDWAALGVTSGGHDDRDGLGSPVIPKIIHHVWVGPNPVPVEWAKRWQDVHPDWDQVIWREPEIRALPLRNVRQFDIYMAKGVYHGAADVARVEILEKYGGVYVDIDSEPLRPFNGAPFLAYGFFAAYTLPLKGHQGRVGNGVMGGVAGHRVLREYRTRIGQAVRLFPAWDTIGGTLLTRVLGHYRTDHSVNILPAGTFYAEGRRGVKANDGVEPYTRHFWSGSPDAVKAYPDA